MKKKAMVRRKLHSCSRRSLKVVVSSFNLITKYLPDTCQFFFCLARDWRAVKQTASQSDASFIHEETMAICKPAKAIKVRVPRQNAQRLGPSLTAQLRSLGKREKINLQLLPPVQEQPGGAGASTVS